MKRQEDLNAKKARLFQRVQQLESSSFTDSGMLAPESTNWQARDFPWTENVEKCLNDTFKIVSFRELQRETINVVMSGKDCLLIMPTGGGKSLCAQLPAVLGKGFTLIISPLVSLMEDQIIAAQALNINASMLRAEMKQVQATEVYKQMVSDNITMKLLYVTPERLAKSKRFMNKLEKAYSSGNLDLIVIDEVHCVSNWGHDFRPDYKFLGILKRQFPKIAILGLTATASDKVVEDVKTMLNLHPSCILFRSSFNRPKLFYEVHLSHQSSLLKQIADRINLKFKDLSGIVYCISRKDCEQVAIELNSHGISAHPYHAYMEADTKSKIHKAWIKGKVKVIVATIAFGMGIDKPNVRFVIHYSISKSMENYYQESGRAGRDAYTAHCIIYFQFADIVRQNTMVFTEKTGLQNLHNMIDYCLDMKTCRRKLIGRYFGEIFDSTQCNAMCDNCKRRERYTVKERDLTSDASTIVQILQQASGRKERVTPLKLLDAWLGDGKVAMRAGKIAQYSRDECERTLSKLMTCQIITEDFHFTPYSTICYVLVGPRWKLLKDKKISVALQIKNKKDTNKLFVSDNTQSVLLSKSSNPNKNKVRNPLDSISVLDEMAPKMKRLKPNCITTINLSFDKNEDQNAKINKKLIEIDSDSSEDFS